MSTEKKQSFSSVISVNPYRDDYVVGILNNLANTKLPAFSKNQLAVSYLNSTNYINNQIEISKNIQDDDLLDAINTKIYDELGLDQAVEYEVQYIETFNHVDDENRHFQVFIVDPLEIADVYKTVVDKIKYIDTITPSPLLIKSLYTKGIIEDNKIHCFIYFQENDSFLSIYNEKEFIYTKSLKYSLLQMHERFCELYGERIEYEEFINFLSTQNLKDTQSDYKEYIFKLYNEIFANINDILAYTKKAFNIEKIELLYIGSQIYVESKLYEIAEVELSIKASDFYFEYGLESSENFIDQIHALMQITTTIPEEEKYLCNFSSFHRPPKFTKRESGKLIMLIAASFIVAFIYPITYWVLLYAQDLQYKVLEDKYNKQHIIKSTREAAIKTVKADKATALEYLAIEKKSYNDKKQTLIKIHDIKVNYPMKSKLITGITKDINKYDLSLNRIRYNQDKDTKTFTLNIASSKDKKITQFLEHITKTHAKKFSFSLEKIYFDEEIKKYLGELKVNIL